MIASHVMIQAQAGPAAIVTAAVREVPGVWETASVAGPGDVIIWAGTRDTAPPTLRMVMNGDPSDAPTSVRIRRTAATELLSTKALRVTTSIPGGGLESRFTFARGNTWQ